ncbi:MFS transporter [Aquisalimonas asiatica]|uniref:Nitrate/nitrite transporter NarK n=1 Tax=Aquisalimonas asiatica TaxID=406100 RepID=A0A1H8UAM5_9GAMM|nr:MFS transporter [Aquisalimonas asiatica]SEO99894.1 Nitrate/nitrite transporter NarK [Aquisalimonas asiatica]
MDTNARPNAVLTVLCGAFTGLVVIVFARLAFGVLLPPMRADLGLTYQQAGTLGTITALGYLLFVLAGGAAAARWGPRRAVVFGLITVGIGFAGLSVATAYPALLALKALLGFGTAFSFAPMVSLLAAWYPEKRGFVIGCMSAGIGVGTLLIGFMVQWLQTLFGDAAWRVSWGLFAAAAAAVAALVIVVVRDPPSTRVAAGERPPSAEKWLIYRHPRMLIVGSVYGLIGLTYIVQAVFMVSFVVESGHPERTAGQLLAMMGLLSVASGPAWGTLSDRWGRGNALLTAMLLVTVATMLPLIDQSLPMFFAHYLIMGCAVNGTFALIQASSTDQVAPRYIPIAFSFATLVFAAGQFVGPAIAGWLIETTGDFRSAFLFTTAGLILGCILTAWIRRFPRELAVGDPPEPTASTARDG